MNVLHICANPKPIGESVSKQLAVTFFTKLAEINPDVDVTNVDLYQNQPPFYSYDTYRCMWYPVFQPGYQPTTAEKNAAQYARDQGALVREADVLVLTMPMWNFSLPAIMKAWIDQVLAPGEVFTLSPEGVNPLHHIKKIILLVSSGGIYKEGDARDALSTQVSAAFGFVKIEDIAVVWADGQNTFFFSDSDERKKMALEAAQDLAEEVAEMATAQT